MNRKETMGYYDYPYKGNVTILENHYTDKRWYDEKTRKLGSLCRFVLRHFGESASLYCIIPKHLLSSSSVKFLVDLFFSEHYDFYKGPGLAYGHAPYVYKENKRYITLVHDTGLDV